ncbi:MAG: hypothetical protein R2856_38440 [Caldilineaceae bacterium]
MTINLFLQAARPLTFAFSNGDTLPDACAVEHGAHVRRPRRWAWWKRRRWR